MPFDPSIIPDTAGSAATTAPAPSHTGKGFDPSIIPDTAAQSPGPENGLSMQGAPTGTDFSQYKFQPKTGIDNPLFRAQAQGNLAQIGLAVGNGIINAATGIIKDIGEIPEIFDSAQDYTNALTEAMDKARDPLGTIYREHPDKTFDLGDPAWWYEQVGGLISAAGRYGTEGWLLGGALGAVSGAAAESLGAGSDIFRTALRASGKLASSSVMGAVMSAEGSAQVYQQAYNYQYQHMVSAGIDPNEASQRATEIASHAAATSFKTGFFTNAALETAVLAPMFRAPKDEVMGYVREMMDKNPGASLGEIKTMLQEAATADPELKRIFNNRAGIWGSRAASSTQMALTMMNLQHATAEGKRVGEGQNRTLFDSLTDMDTYLDDVTNQEGLLSLITGAAVGFGQSALIDALPSRMVDRYDENNNPVYKTGVGGKLVEDPSSPTGYKVLQHLVSPKSYNAFMARNYYDQVSGAILEDVNRLQSLHADLLKATAAGNIAEVENLKSQLFSVAALDAVPRGMGDVWKNTFQQIAATDNTKTLADELQPQLDDLNTKIRARVDAQVPPVEGQAPEQAAADNQKAQQQDPELVDLTKQRDALLQQIRDHGSDTEAMRKGYASSTDDNGYKQRAQQAIQDLDALKTLHTQLTKKYLDRNGTRGPDPQRQELVDHLFARAGNLYLTSQVIAREEARIAGEEATAISMNTVDAAIKALHDYQDYRNQLKPTITALNQDIDTFRNIGEKGDSITDQDIQTVKNLIRKYQGKGTSDADIPGAIKDLTDKLNRKVKMYQKLIKGKEDTLMENSLYQQWKVEHPDDSFRDYMEQVREDRETHMDRANLEVLKASHEIAQENYEELTTPKGVRKLMRAILDGKQKAVAEMTAKARGESTRDFLLSQEKKAAAALSLRDNQDRAQEIRKQITDLTEKTKELESRRLELAGKMREQPFTKKVASLLADRKKMNQLEREIAQNRAHLSQLTDKLQVAEDAIRTALAKKQKVDNQPIQEMKQEPNPVPVPASAPEVTPTSAAELPDVTPTETQSPTLAPVQTQTEPEVSEATAAELPKSAQQQFLEYVQTLPKAAMVNLLSMGEILRREGKEPSLQAIEDLMSHYPGVEGRKAYLHLKNYLKELEQPVTSVPLAEPPAPLPTAGEEPRTPPAIESDQPEMASNQETSPDTGDTPNWNEKHARVTSAFTVASSDTQYMHVRSDEGEGKTRDFRSRTNEGRVMFDEKSSKLRMLPPGHGGIQVGDELVLRVEPDRTKAFEIVHDDELENTEFHTPGTTTKYVGDYLRGGKIDLNDPNSFGEIPIQIVHKRTGTVIGYVHRLDWVTATHGSGNYTHMPDEWKATRQKRDENGNAVYDKNGKPEMEQYTRTPADEREALQNLRRHIAQLWNQDKGSTVEREVTGRTEGNLLMTQDVPEYASTKTGEVGSRTVFSRLVNRLAKDQLPDPSLKFGIETDWGLRGRLMVLLPTPAGTVSAQPLRVRTLGGTGKNRSLEMTTLLRSIELHLRSKAGLLTPAEKNMVERIKEATGKDLTLISGAKQFMEQYFTRTTSFPDALVEPGADPKVAPDGTTSRPMRFMLQMKNGDIKIGTSYAGADTLFRAKLDSEGQLDQDFMEQLENGLRDRPRQVNVPVNEYTTGEGSRIIRGVNYSNKFTEVLIDATDKLRVKEYPNYNEYLKSFAYTYVDGTHQIEDPTGIKRYVYFANSQVQFSQDVPIDRSAAEIPVTEPEQVGGIVSPVGTEKETVRADVSSDSIAFNRYVTRPDGMDITQENLEKLMKEVPEDKRSNLTPEEMRISLRDQGITRIPEGYNPFRVC